MERYTSEQAGYTPYDHLRLANQISRKFGVFDRKLEGSHFTFYCYSSMITNETAMFKFSISYVIKLKRGQNEYLL